MLMVVLAGLCTIAAPARADPARVILTPNTALRFGNLFVPQTGSRTISATGSVSDIGLYQIGASSLGPAQFTISYDRGNNSPRPINVRVQIVLTSFQQLQVGGVSGTLSQLEVDLPSSVGTFTGNVITLTLQDCRQRVCSQTFRIGGRLDVTRSTGGAVLVFPLPAVANVIDVF